MEAIINKYMSLMIDEILEKALEEKPKYTTKEDIVYEYFEISTGRFKGEYFIRYITHSAQCNMNTVNNYDLQLKPYQKEMINKIFEKWG